MDSGDKVVAHYVGNCHVKVDTNVSPCDDLAVYDLRTNGDAAVIVRAGDLTVIFEGHNDRQPNPENYYLRISRLLTKNGGQKAQMILTEGECHFSGNTVGDEEYSIDCTVYNRRTGLLAVLNFDDITETEVNINDSALTDNVPDPAQSREDRTIARRAGKIVNATLKQTGMAGLNTKIQQCYASAQQRRSESALEQCFIIDFLANQIDSAYVKMIHRPWLANAENKIAAVYSRVNRALDRFGFNDALRQQKISEWASAAPIGLNEIQ